MNSTELYEKIPPDPQIRILRYCIRPYDFPAHWHEHTEIHFIFAGSCTLRCGEEYRRLTSGDCVVINSCELHEGVDGYSSYLCLILPPAFFESEHILFQGIIRDPFLSDTAARLDACTKSAAAPDRLEARAHACLLAAHLMRHYVKKSLSVNAWAGYTAKQSKVNEAVRLIGLYYDQPLTTRTLAEQLYLSECYFCKIFKEITGRTVIDYINRFRIAKAQELLQKTRCSITEAALGCGIGDANYFTRLYKRINGCPPSAGRTELG